MNDTIDPAARVNGATADLSDLDTAAADEGRILEVRNRQGEVMRHDDGRPFTITLYGAESSKFRTLAMQQQDRRNQRVFRTRTPDRPEIVERDSIELLVAVTKDCDIVLDGKPVEATPQNIRAIYQKYIAVREQVDQFVGNAANFTKG